MATRKEDSFSIKKDTDADTSRSTVHLRLPVGIPTDVVVQPKGSMIYNPVDQFVYVSDGINWDRLSGVNNPVDNLLPASGHRVTKWVEDFPPGNSYSTPVLQDSSMEIDDDGNATLNDTGNTPDAFPHLGGNLLVHGSLVTSYVIGLSLDPVDPTLFTPILGQTHGIAPTIVAAGDVGIGSGTTRDSRDPKARSRYDNGSVAVGHCAMEQIMSSSSDPSSIKNTAMGVKALQHITVEAEDNTAIGWGAMMGESPSSVTGINNVAIGSHSMGAATTASHNVVIGAGTHTLPTINGAVVIGATSVAMTSGNVIIGYKSTDNGHGNVIMLGAGVSASGSDRLVLGSGITAKKAHPDNERLYHITIQIGDETYQLPLTKVVN